MIYVTTGGYSDKTAAETVSDYLEAGINHIELSAGKYSADIQAELMPFTKKCNFTVHNYFPVPKEPFVLNLASMNEEIFLKSQSFLNVAKI